MIATKFNTFSLSLPDIRDEDILFAIAGGLITIIANQFNTEGEMDCIFNRDIAYFRMGEIITDATLSEDIFQDKYQKARIGLDNVLTNQITTLESIVTSSDGLADVIPLISPGMILLYIREGLQSNINGTYASIENDNEMYFEYCQIVGDKPSNAFITNGDFSEII